MADKIRGNEALVALVLVNACAAFAVLSAYGPENTRPFIIMVATLMGMAAFYPIYKLLHQPQRYVIRKEKAGDLESYIIRYKGYLWWYDGKDINGHRLAFKSKEEALEYVRKNVITRLINERIRQQRQQQKKAKKEYETILDPIAENLDVDTLLDMADADSPTEQPKNPHNGKDNQQETEHDTPKKREPLVIDNKSSLEMLEKQIQSTNANQQERNDTEDNKENGNDAETEEEDEKPLGEITHEPVPPTMTDDKKDGKKIHPAQELMNTFNEFLPESKPKRESQEQKDANEKENENPSQTQENEEKETNIQNIQKNETEETKVLTLSNENPIHRLGPESVTEEMKKILFHSQREKENGIREKEDENKKKATFNTLQQTNVKESEESPKTKRKGRRKTYDDTVVKMRQLTIDDMLPENENKEQPPTDKTSSGGHKVVKRLEDVKPPENEKVDDKIIFIEPPKEKEPIEDFQDGSEIKTKEPDEMKPHNDNQQPNMTDMSGFWDGNSATNDNQPEPADNNAIDYEGEDSEEIWEENYHPSP